MYEAFFIVHGYMCRASKPLVSIFLTASACAAPLRPRVPCHLLAHIELQDIRLELQNIRLVYFELQNIRLFVSSLVYTFGVSNLGLRDDTSVYCLGFGFRIFAIANP